MSENVIIPGNKIAVIEEYESGENTFDDGHFVRATVLGTTELDKKNRIVKVQSLKSISIPKINDVIIGTIVAVMSSMIAVSIDYINGKAMNSKVECICQTRNFRKKTIGLVKDIVMLKIINHLNGTIHATMNEPELGIILTKCKKCGSKVITMRDAIKCIDCGWIDDRKLSTHFGSSDFLKISD